MDINFICIEPVLDHAKGYNREGHSWGELWKTTYFSSKNYDMVNGSNSETGDVLQPPVFTISKVSAACLPKDIPRNIRGKKEQKWR